MMSRDAPHRIVLALAAVAVSVALSLATGCGTAVLTPGVVADPPRPDSDSVQADIPALFQAYSESIVPHQMIVRYRAATTGEWIKAREASDGAVVVRQDLGGLLRLLTLPPETDLLTTILAYLAMPEVEYAEPNLRMTTTSWPGAAVAALPDPNDPLYPRQWSFPQIGVRRAWELTGGGSRSVVVAIVDTGVAYRASGIARQAPDLAATHFVAGTDIVNNDSDPTDDQGHGTHVCGTIAQSTDNGIGCAGVAPEVSIMPVKVLDWTGGGTSYGVAAGIRWAVDNGANVINLSLGGAAPERTIRDACQYAYERNVVVCAAAGNESGPVGYPAAYSSTIAVSATDLRKNLTPYSCYGPQVDVAAPGGDTTKDRDGDGFPDGILQETFRDMNVLLGFDYVYLQGTSMATPHVTGVVALMFSAGLGSQAGNATDLVREIFRKTCEDLGAKGHDEQYGDGLVRADRALELLTGGTPIVDDPWNPPAPEEPPLPSETATIRPGTQSPWVQFGSPVDALASRVFEESPDVVQWWDPTTAIWTSVARFSVGSGAFLKLSGPVRAYFPTESRVSMSQLVKMPLRAGYNMLGNPYDVDLNWDGDVIEVWASDDSKVGTLNEAWDRYILVGYGWTWDPDQGKYVLVADRDLGGSRVSTVGPHCGIWVRSFQNGLQLVWRGTDVTGRSAQSKGRDRRLDDPRWQVLLEEMRTAAPPPAPGG